MAIPNHIIKRIEDQIDIVELVGRYMGLERRGDRYWGCCPFHIEKTPSFTVSPSRGTYYCFGCKKTGGIFQFIMEIEKISFVESIHYFANQLGIVVQGNDEQTDIQGHEKKALLGLYQRLIKTFEHCLWNSAAGEMAVSYLQERGLSEDTIRYYRIGYAPREKGFLYKFLTKKGYSEALLAKSGLFSRKYPEYPFFLHRILFPIFQPTGEAVAFSGRLLNEDTDRQSPKYLNSPDSIIYNKKMHLYGLMQAKKEIAEHGFMLCEGAMDVCAMYQMGYHQAVASLGTGFTEEQAKLLRRYNSNGYIIFDNDEAGQKAKKSAILLFEKLEMHVKIVDFEQEKDPGEILEKKKLKGLQKVIENAKIPIEFLIGTAVKTAPGTAVEVVRVCQEIFPFIQVVSSPVLQDNMIRTLAGRLGLKEGVVFDEFQRFCKKSINRSNLGERTIVEQDLQHENPYQFNGTVYELLKIFLGNPACCAEYVGFLRKSWLDTPESQAVVNYLKNENDKIGFLPWLETRDSFDLNVKRYLLQPLELLYEDTQQYVQAVLKQLEVKELEKECLYLAQMIKDAEQRGDDSDTVNDLMKDYVLLVQELQQLKAGL